MNTQPHIERAKRSDEIKINLNVIQLHRHTKGLHKLFDKEVRDLLSDMSFISSKVNSIFSPVPHEISDERKMEKLWEVVRDLAGQIPNLPRVNARDIRDIEAQRKNFNEQVNLFQAGLEALGHIPRHHRPRVREDSIKAAIYSDHKELEAAFARQLATRQEITLIDMEIDSDSDSGTQKEGRKKKRHTLPLDQDWSTCRKIKRHMMATGIAKAPDLWCRLVARHQLTSQQLSWTRANLGDPVQGPFVDFVNASDRLKAYIVVLRHHVEEETDVPRAVEIPVSGTKCSCDCEQDVTHHFKQLWPEWVVDGESIYDIRINTKIENRTFDTSVYDPLQNQLCVFVKSGARMRKQGENRVGEQCKEERKMVLDVFSCNLITKEAQWKTVNEMNRLQKESCVQELSLMNSDNQILSEINQVN